MNNKIEERGGFSLLLDIGNTSAKVALTDGSKLLHFERREGTWKELFSRLKDSYPIQRCVISNVGGIDTDLLQTLEMQSFPIKWISYEMANPVVPECVAPRGLGADRWAADIGAMALLKSEDQEWHSALLVIDAGTCITYDLIGADGKYIGGNIAPGVELRIKAMHEHTALLPLVPVDGETPLMGYNTETAMRAGAVNGARLEIEGYVRELMKDYPDIKVFVTGGNNFCFSHDIVALIRQEPVLIFHGLMKCL